MKHISLKQGVMILLAITAAGLMAALAARGAAGPPKLETIVLGQTRFLAGSQASLRIVTLQGKEGKPVGGARIEAIITPSSKDTPGTPNILFKSRTDRTGTLNATFKVPDIEEGTYKLDVRASALGESDVISSEITVYSDRQILLTTDKPLYQPGQTMHIRSLALNKSDRSAVSNTKFTLEVEDGKGNKVFKKSGKTSEFGIASAEFILADEVNMGRYTIRAIIGTSKSEKNVNVERYVLPKFKVKFTPDRTYYLPGETVSGKVQVDYFFGKPVTGARVELKASTFDYQFKEFAQVVGKTDDYGSFSFEQKLPDYFVGQPLEQGNAFVQIEVVIKDTADHTEKITQMVPVAAQPIRIVVVPESGRIIPGVENTLYIMTTSPDGAPAQTDFTMRIDGSDKPLTGKTSDTGIGEIKFTPTKPGIQVEITAEDTRNRTATTSVSLAGSAEEDAVLLACDKVLAKVGDRVNLTVLSPTKRGSAYIDVIKDKQTIHTDATDFHNGRADFDLRITDEMAGSIEVRAYRISKSGNIVRDSRMMFIDPADDLSVKISPDKDSYLAGKQAKIAFEVTKPGGKGAASALGVSIVDESVFALQEMRPGMEKIYFLLEKELMEPKFEIHGLDPGVIFRPMIGLPSPEESAANRQQAAKVLFALYQQDQQNASASDPYALHKSTFTDKFDKWLKSHEQFATKSFAKIAKAISEYPNGNGLSKLKSNGGLQKLVELKLLSKSDLLDEWGKPYSLPKEDMPYGDYYLALISSGYDRKPGTDDDIIVFGTISGARFMGMARYESGKSYWDQIVRRGVFKGEAFFDMAPAAGMPGMAGGMGGGMIEEREMALPMVALAADSLSIMDDKSAAAPGKEPVRVRQFFPETMYFNPSVITDDNGKAEISLDCADSITTWRVSASASTKQGELGAATGGLKVFQDFFIDIDFPVSLTQNDEISIPVAVYNYLPESQTVTLEIGKEPWFTLMDSETRKLDIGSGDVRAIYYRIKVKQIGSHTLTVHANGSKMSDAIKRSVDVIPDGQLRETVENGRLEKTVDTVVNIPQNALDGASNILVKVYPGIFSTLVEGMDGIFQMPFGCFEQTTSTTYPNVLALGYMKETNQVKPEVRMKAEQYINLGYQRLVTFEVPGGGFSWFGDAPANKVLTAYGVMEFADMSKVWEVDPNLISRTGDWLISQREQDGSWKPDAAFLHAENWGKIQNNNLLPTAWISWCLLKSGRDAGQMRSSVSYIKEHALEAKDAYSAALVANALVLAEKDGQATTEALKRLVDMAKTDGDTTYWKSEVSTVTFSEGSCADVETTAIAALALIDSGTYPDVATRALNYIVKSKTPNGTWGSTQATVMSLKALLTSLANKQQDIDANVKVTVNGKEAGTFKVTKEDSDVMRQVDCKQLLVSGKNTVRIEFEGKGSMMYAVVGRHYVPWDKTDKIDSKLISIDIDYDRTELASDDILTAKAHIALNRPGTANMVIVDLGIPPGFQVQSQELDKLVKDGVIQRFSQTSRQVILYFEKIEKDKPIDITYRMKAKFPVKARTPKSEVYLYYEPEVRATSAPVELTVK